MSFRKAYLEKEVASKLESDPARIASNVAAGLSVSTMCAARGMTLRRPLLTALCESLRVGESIAVSVPRCAAAPAFFLTISGLLCRILGKEAGHVLQERDDRCDQCR